VEALASMPSLRVLSVDNNRIGAQGSDVLVPLLSSPLCFSVGSTLHRVAQKSFAKRLASQFSLVRPNPVRLRRIQGIPTLKAWTRSQHESGVAAYSSRAHGRCLLESLRQAVSPLSDAR
jgi:hypothetical protein